MANIYSTILAGIQLTVRKTQSEYSAQDSPKPRLPTISLQEVSEEEPDVLPQVWDAPELQLIKRLSCFEEICPSSERFDSSLGFSLPLGVTCQLTKGRSVQNQDGPGESDNLAASDEVQGVISASKILSGVDSQQSGVDDQKRNSTQVVKMLSKGRKGKNRKFHQLTTVTVANPSF